MNRRLAVLMEFGQLLASAEPLRQEQICLLIYQQASRLMDTNNMYIALYDEPTGLVNFGLAVLDGKRLPLNVGNKEQPGGGEYAWVEWILQQRKPALVSTKAEAEAFCQQYADLDWVEGWSRSSWIGVPIVLGKRVLGAIAICHPMDDHGYSSEDLEILQAMASQAAIALDNVALSDQIEREVSRRVASNVDAEVGGLVRAFAHHVRSKTGLIRAEAMDLLDDADLDLPRPALRSLAKIVDHVEGIRQLISSLFRPYGIAERQIVPVDRLLGNVVSSFTDYEDIKLNWVPNPELPMIEIEAVNAITYFEEIIINAVKAIRRSGKPGEIRIESRLGDDGFVEILFSDDGPPVPEDLRETIFDQFTVGPESVQETGVHGLGLWGARVFFERQEGSIHLKDSNKEWTTFLVRLLPSTAKQ
jgi:signal transduction histidine kinase